MNIIQATNIIQAHILTKLSQLYNIANHQRNIITAQITCFKLYSSFQNRLNIIKAKKLCSKSNIEAIEGDEYFIQKKYNNHHTHKKRADKKVGNNISFFLYWLYNFSLKNIINQNNIDIHIEKATNQNVGSVCNAKYENIGNNHSNNRKI